MSRQHMEPVVSLNGSASRVKPRSRRLQLGKKAGKKAGVRLPGNKYIWNMIDTFCTFCKLCSTTQRDDGHLARHLFKPGQPLLWFRLHG